MTPRPGLRSLLLLLGSGVVVATGVAVVRVWRRRAATSSTVEELAAAGPESVTMPTGSVPVGAMDVASVAVAAPSVSPAEQVVPHSRDAEEVVESLIPPEMHAPRTDRRVDILIAVLVIAAALAVVLAIVRLG